jgi:hypothetical protein
MLRGHLLRAPARAGDASVLGFAVGSGMQYFDALQM